MINTIIYYEYLILYLNDDILKIIQPQERSLTYKNINSALKRYRFKTDIRNHSTIDKNCLITI